VAAELAGAAGHGDAHEDSWGWGWRRERLLPIPPSR
jgi:hypothetical protein